MTGARLTMNLNVHEYVRRRLQWTFAAAPEQLALKESATTSNKATKAFPEHPQ